MRLVRLPAFPMLVITVCLAIGVTAVRGQETARGQAPADLPASLQPALARAERGMDALQRALLERLREELAAGGPARAVSVCRDEAPAITARVAREQGIALGRTSHLLRNSSNGSPAWAVALVRESAGSRASAHGLRVFDLGDRVGVARPIGFIDMCASCHGAPATIPAAVRDVIAAAYKNDSAVGFAPGDLRGWMWAEVAKP